MTDNQPPNVPVVAHDETILNGYEPMRLLNDWIKNGQEYGRQELEGARAKGLTRATKVKVLLDDELVEAAQMVNLNLEVMSEMACAPAEEDIMVRFSMYFLDDDTFCVMATLAPPDLQLPPE